MIPKRILPYFNTTHENIDSDNTQIEGVLTCCSSHDFEIYAVGEIKSSIFSKMYLFPKECKIALEARCKKCGKVIPVFDSNYDGYICCEKNYNIPIAQQNLLDVRSVRKIVSRLVLDMNILIFKS